VTLSVVAPGDTNPSDATGRLIAKLLLSFRKSGSTNLMATSELFPKIEKSVSMI